jgi:hypothetical protein
VKFTALVIQFQSTTANTCWKFTHSMIVCYVVDHEQAKSLISVYRVFSTNTDDTFMWMSEI